VSSTRWRQTAIPALGHDQPRPQAAPYLHVLAAIGQHRAVSLSNSQTITPDFHRHITGIIHSHCFHAQAFVPGLAKLPQQALHRFGSTRGIAMRRHEHTIRREQRRHLIIISGVEGGYKILSKSADNGLHIQKRTRVRKGTRIGPVHLLPPWGGRHHVNPSVPENDSPVLLAHSSAKGESFVTG